MNVKDVKFQHVVEVAALVDDDFLAVLIPMEDDGIIFSVDAMA